jgi:hypothetical protein
MGQLSQTPFRVFLDASEKCGLCPRHQHLTRTNSGKIKSHRIPARTAVQALVNTFRPVQRTYSTKITCQRRPAAATFRFIAYQAYIFYHKTKKIASFFCYRIHRT